MSDFSNATKLIILIAYWRNWVKHFLIRQENPLGGFRGQRKETGIHLYSYEYII